MKSLVIGLGNTMRGDDGIGPEVVRILSGKKPSLSDYLILDNEILIPSEDYKNRKQIILVDALEDNTSETGAIFRIHPSDVVALKKSRVSSHGMGVDQWINMINLMNAPPPEIIIYGIVGKNFDLGNEISEKVRKSMDELVTKLIEILIRK